MRYRIGVNYWPAESAMRWWRRFDPDAVSRDFGRIAAAGFDSVRIFLLWEDFQPRPDTVSDDALALLRQTADMALRNGLGLLPTLFTGHMSGANWLPEWAVAAEPARVKPRFRVVTGDRARIACARSWYDDEEVVAAQELLASQAARTLRGHAALWMWDLGNENSNVCLPATQASGRAWLVRMSAALREGDPDCRITLGMHMEDLEEDRRIGPADAAEVCDVLSMHGYPLYAPWSGDPLSPRLLPFLARVTRALGRKAVLFEEFGIPTAGTDTVGAGAHRLFTEREAATFIGGALDALHEAGTTGAILWCFSDYARAIWSEPPLDEAAHERFFGMWRADGSPKAGVAEITARAGRKAVADRVADEVVLDGARYYDNPSLNLRQRLWRSVGGV